MKGGRGGGVNVEIKSLGEKAIGELVDRDRTKVPSNVLTLP